MSNLQEIIQSLENSTNKVFEIESNFSKTYSEVFLNAKKIASSLSTFQGKNISVILPNGIEYIETMLGVILSGNVFNPIPYFVEISEIPRILKYVAPEFVITDRQDLLVSDIGFNFIQPYSKSFESSQSNNDCSLKNLDDSTIAALYYSSGTTGNPKGVLYSHSNIVHLIQSIIRGFDFNKDVSHMTLLPFGHTASLNYNIWPSLFNKNELHISKGFEHLRSTFFKEISDRKINYVQIVPTVGYMILKFFKDTQGYDISCLRYIGCGSSTLPLETQNAFYKNYNIKISNLYGLSETGPSHIDNPLHPDWHPGSIGKPLDVNECKIADDGEILLRGKNVFVGYYGNEKLFSEVVTSDGWFHTGDIGEFKDGIFYYKDRKKDLIIKSGINIVPAEIEEIIYEFENIFESIVIGIEDPVFGEKILCCFTVKNKLEDEKTYINNLRNFCRSKLTNYKVPDKFVLVDSIPKTESGKLLRRKMRELYK